MRCASTAQVMRRAGRRVVDNCNEEREGGGFQERTWKKNARVKEKHLCLATMSSEHETPVSTVMEEGALVAMYRDGKTVRLSSLARRKFAPEYSTGQLHRVRSGEVFNVAGFAAFSFVKKSGCRTMRLVELRPWLLHPDRPKRSARCGRAHWRVSLA